MAGSTVRRRGLVAVVAALSLAAAACGTTVPNASQKLAQGNQVTAGGLGQEASGGTGGGALGTDGAGGGAAPARARWGRRGPVAPPPRPGPAVAEAQPGAAPAPDPAPGRPRRRAVPPDR